MKRFAVRQWGKCGWGVFLLALVTLDASVATPKRILILDPFGRDVAPFSTVVSAFRTTLARELEESVDFYEVPLEMARSTEPEGEGPLVAFLEDRIKSNPVDLVVPIGGAGVQFAARHRERLFPNWKAEIAARRGGRSGGAGTKLLWRACGADELPADGAPRLADWFRSCGIGLSAEAMPFQTPGTILDDRRSAPPRCFN
jgi:hypothetical protein